MLIRLNDFKKVFLFLEDINNTTSDWHIFLDSLPINPNLYKEFQNYLSNITSIVWLKQVFQKMIDQTKPLNYQLAIFHIINDYIYNKEIYSDNVSILKIYILQIVYVTIHKKDPMFFIIQLIILNKASLLNSLKLKNWLIELLQSLELYDELANLYLYYGELVSALKIYKDSNKDERKIIEFEERICMLNCDYIHTYK